MGFLIAAVLFLFGGFILVDAFMMAGSVSNIMQQDYVQTRLFGGAALIALAAILWVLSAISENLGKLAKAPAVVLSPAPQAQPAAPLKVADRPTIGTSGWTCAECGKVNQPMAPVCACGNLAG